MVMNQWRSASSTLQGSKFNDSITGNTSPDSILGNGGNDTIYGGDGADTINAGKGNDSIEDAGIGNDLIHHTIGSSLVIKVTGSDTVTVNATRAGAFVVVTVAGQCTVDASDSTKSVGLQGIGAAENSVSLTGGLGGDTIDGSAASDQLIGNQGNDTITGGLSSDTIHVGSGDDTVVFTSGLSVDTILEYDSTDIGSFDLTKLEEANAVVDGETIDFVTGANTSVVANDLISMQAISGNTTLLATTNVLNYTASTAADAAALENKLENNDIVTTNRSLAENDAFVIQYKDSDTNMYSYAIAYIETAGVNASTAITNWEVVDIATTNQDTAFGEGQFSFIVT